MAIDHTQLDDVPRRLAAGPFAATRAGNLVIGDRLTLSTHQLARRLTSGMP